MGFGTHDPGLGSKRSTAELLPPLPEVITPLLEVAPTAVRPYPGRASRERSCEPPLAEEIEVQRQLGRS